MTFRFSLWRLVTIAVMFAAAVGLNAEPMNAIVKVFSVQSRPNFMQPWQNYPQSSATGSGFVISGGRIITNAHVVANQTFVQVRKQGDPKKYIAKLEAVGHECDLAVLKVDAPEFYQGIVPLELGDFPELQDKVHVTGYPVGGDNIAVTAGVVSRIEPIVYSHSDMELLAIQIDAAINPGNSGGPVIKNGKVIGVAFQGLSETQNIGYMIPPNVIKHFLSDIQDGKFDGFPEFGVHYVRMENPDMRAWVGMKNNDSGVLITFLAPSEAKKGLLQVNDVIMEVDGVKIANDCTIPFRRDEVIQFETMLWNKSVGDKCRFKILRKGQVMEIDYPLTGVERLVPMRMFDRLPDYYLVGGLLFTSLSTGYLDFWRNWWNNAPRRLVNYAAYGDITDKYDEIVVISEVLADETNAGYQNIRYLRVVKLNGTEIKNLRDLIARVEAQKDGYLELDLDDHQKIVLDLKKCRNATPIVMKRYRIPSDRSAKLSLPGGKL